MTTNPSGEAAVKAMLANTSLTVAKSNLRDLLGRPNAPLELIEAHLFQVSKAIEAARTANSERDAAAALTKSKHMPVTYIASAPEIKRPAQFAGAM